MRNGVASRLGAHARRVRDIAAVLGRHGLAEALHWLDVDFVQDRLRAVDGSRLRELPFAVRVRLAATELGTTFQKLGQMLGTRPDLVGAELAAELGKLQAKTVADPPEVVRARIQEELGRAPEVLFAAFDDVPLATASIAQVHAATLRTGEAVVVKLVRTGVEAGVCADLDILTAAATMIEAHSKSLRAWRPSLVVRQFRRSLLRELDLGQERANLERFCRAFKATPGVRFPRPHAEHCSRGALTMERLDGVLLLDEGAIRSSGADLAKLARVGAQLWIDMVFRDAFFHADPHPGNLLLLSDGSLGVVDCGMTGRLDGPLRELLETMLVHVFEQDSAGVTDCMLRLCRPREPVDREELRADMEEIILDFAEARLADAEIGAMLGALFGALHRHRLALPAQLAVLLRTLVVLEGSSRSLDRSFRLVELLAPAYRRAARRRWAPSRVASRALHVGQAWEQLATVLPGDLRAVLERMREGDFRVRLEHRHLDDSVNRLTLGVLVAALVLAAASLWTSPAPPRAGGHSLLGAVFLGIAALLGIRLWRLSRRALRDRSD